MSRKFLYRRLGSAVTVIVILAFFAVMAPRGVAQGGRPQLKRPEDIPQEKPPEPKKKKVKGPRAVGLLQLNSKGKGTLIPIAILVDGKFYNASVYKADPVPMALESGTVYEVEQAGDSQGLFTVNGALHSKSPSSPHPWVGAGSYLPNGTEAAKATRKAEDVPVGLDDRGDEPPRLSKANAAKPVAAPSPSPASTSGTPASSSSAGTGSSEKPAAASSPPVSSQPAASSSGGASTGQDAPKTAGPAASDKPADQSAKQQAPAPTAGQTSPEPSSSGQTSQGQEPQAQASQGQASQGQPGENYYRPTLRRGKPTQSAPEEDETTPTAGKPGSAGTATATSTEPVRVLPAISDAGGPEPQPYKFFWKTGEEEENRNQMLALAADEVRAYASALAKNVIPAKPPTAKAAAAAHKPPAKPLQPVFENVQFRAFDVWVNNQPVMILTAEAHFPPAPGAIAGPEQYSITLVARTDIYGSLRKLYSGVTDKFHLDVTPRLELIDAVDADGDGRGELLFRETTDAGNGYVIYRATADRLWKIFDSLGEE
jgi:hypothetical protein